MRLLRPIAAAGLLISGLGVSELLASGSYPPAPPRLRSDVTQNIDPVAYNLGKSIYAGRANIASMSPLAGSARAEFRDALEQASRQMPDRARDRIDVDQLSRSLDQEGSKALLYYLQLRFRLTEVTA